MWEETNLDSVKLVCDTVCTLRKLKEIGRTEMTYPSYLLESNKLEYFIH